MLHRMYSEQIVNHWDTIKDAIEVSLPPIAGESPDKMNNILKAILAGQMVIWLSYRKHEDRNEVTGFVITSILSDHCTMTKSLLLYIIYSPEDRELGDDGWAEGFAALQKYGKKIGCDRMVGYSDNEKVIEMVERYGGDSSYRFMSVPL